MFREFQERVNTSPIELRKQPVPDADPVRAHLASKQNQVMLRFFPNLLFAQRAQI